jgi:hypothetical protein
MAKRALRVVKHLGRIPAVAACTVCGKTFEAPLGALVSVKGLCMQILPWLANIRKPSLEIGSQILAFTGEVNRFTPAAFRANPVCQPRINLTFRRIKHK